MDFFKKIFGSNERVIGSLQPVVDAVNVFSDTIDALSDDELRGKTETFRTRLSKGETEEDILPEAFAVVREAAKRVIGERHYDVQLMGGAVLHQGKIAEMKTGEGKTLTSTLPIYLNALSGKGVHVVTVNDYLASRDANWMGRVFHFLGLSTACILQQGISYRYEPNVTDSNEVSVEHENLIPVTRREAYAADITYGTNNEFGFDYLRDNMVGELSDMVQRELHFAIVDEVDSILIDEARTPLIISAPDAESTKLYERFAKIVPRLRPEEDFVLDEKFRTVTLTDQGITRVEELLGMPNLYDQGNIQYVHHLEQSLKAQFVFHLDRDYVVREGEVLIVDDFTGRIMQGRRYSEGLHQALEAKEGVAVQRESRTLATITFQNYFRLYKKLAGMTGTASTSAEEFSKVYKLDVVTIPTNKILIRKDLPDIIYKTEEVKFQKIAEEVKRISAEGQPILIGTIAIEKSEYLSALLEREGVKHNVLNAKQHEREAAIIAGAGQKGAVTIATNMAGRGTDIKLGEGVRERGGLVIIGTERHEARRIDNQLRGRAGRQGDPGQTRFFISLEDELMRRFAGDRLKNMMNTMGLPDEEPIESGAISKMIESAQTKIEGFNFDIRKHVLEYDDVMNRQREVTYRRRREALGTESMDGMSRLLLEEELDKMIAFHCAGHEAEWALGEIAVEANGLFPVLDEKVALAIFEEIREDRSKDESEKKELIREYLSKEGMKVLESKAEAIPSEAWDKIQRVLYVQALDQLWMNHLDEIEYLRQGIGLRGYGQRDPLVEYKREAFNLFTGLLDAVRKTYLLTVLKIEPAQASPVAAVPRKNVVLSGASDTPAQFGADENDKGEAVKQEPIHAEHTVGRNDPCPCGAVNPATGEVYKFKKCGMINAPYHRK
ncbi:MAG: preprotein translocase subunit SecA [Candidatus Moranbacteria bacterium]|nr:preprotein translocase subunit SecA [Candidatus Moranbacteria bacterium]NTW75857.1 preprotein translocase subunit SecA [Candidatus Moranbacteria bacterium]